SGLTLAAGAPPPLGRLAGMVPGMPPHAVEELKTPVEELLRLLRARGLRSGAEQPRKHPAAAAMRGCDQAVACGFGMPGLDAVDARIEPQQPVAVRLDDVVVAELALRIVLAVFLGKVVDQRRRQEIKVLRGAVVLGIGQPGR